MLVETVVDEAFVAEMDEFRAKPKGKGLLEACSESVVLFAEHMLGVTLYSWQVKFLTGIQKAANGDYWTREFLALTSRQIGKSMSVAILSLWATTFNKVPGGVGNSTLVGIFSASDIQAKKLLYEIKKLIRMGDRHMKETYGDKFKDDFFSELLDDNEPNNTTTITFKAHNQEVHGDYLLKDSNGGSSIKSYPPTSSVLGETFTLLVEDEAGKSDRFTDAAHDDYISPTGDAFNAIRIYTSTPWTLSGFFYRLADPENIHDEHNYERLMFTCEAIKDENKVQYEVIKKKVDKLIIDGQKDVADRAYYCRFVKGEMNYFAPEKVRDMFDDTLSQTDSFSGECDMGVDFGGKEKSKTVITISTMEEDGTVRRLYHRSYPVGGDEHLLDDIASLLRVFNVQRIIPDECPAAQYLIPEMRNKGWNIHPMNFRSDKVKKYGAFRAALNRGEIVSYRDDDLLVEMNSLEFAHGNRQSVIHPAPGYNDDLIDSFVMSCYFFVQEDEGFRYYDIDDYEVGDYFDAGRSEWL